MKNKLKIGKSEINISKINIKIGMEIAVYIIKEI